uniref:Myotropin-2 n=2 Tax=Acrididae TaxID=7002 RepID=MYOT2_SCHGR|nr:RecName: Full=Myotropin-2; AltName: Full=Scg-MT-2 [Schistocerca gregaria]P85866.1 RecName: Full=Myotropin-2; AltName: Full=Scg-MT-2 [Locusta migratoria]
TSSLFPHPRL